MTDRTNALLYLRTAHANEGAIAEQRHRCTALAAAQGWKVIHAVVANGVSGAGDAPGLTILRDRIASGEAQAVIAIDPTRISRDPEKLLAFERFCTQNDADLSFVEPAANLGSLRAPFSDGGKSAPDMTNDTDRQSGFQPPEFRL
ncbi:recombinase family protein [Palleronia sp. LCG004]|uniref:recombinase family protein n=1 Tax=Palleronia sp. LCG004 TaxID=3079304 RepID=UPI00294358C9|nr:recombinase family protein [Palleronia sp. LCG004]WOI56075.1 recombinase family protein [Palleronia sp. LCG004]